jgi:hypothetical protein
MTIQPGDRAFIRLSFVRFGLSEPLHILLGLGNSPDELFDVELSVLQRPHPGLRASISAPLERVPINFRDDAGCICSYTAVELRLPEDKTVAAKVLIARRHMGTILL